MEGSKKRLGRIGAGQFLILDLDADYMGIFSSRKFIKLSFMIITLFYTYFIPH